LLGVEYADTVPVQVPFHGVFAKVGVLRNEVTRFTDYGGFDEDVVFFIAAIRGGSLISTIGAEAAAYSLGASICERTLPKDHVSAVYARPTKKGASCITCGTPDAHEFTVPSKHVPTRSLYNRSHRENAVDPTLTRSTYLLGTWVIFEDYDESSFGESETYL